MSLRQVAKRKRLQFCQCFRTFSSSSLRPEENRSSRGQVILDILKSSPKATQSQQLREESSTQSLFSDLINRAFQERRSTPTDSPRSSLYSALDDAAIAEADQTRKALLRQSPRRWTTGQVYAPHDLSPVEASKYSVIRRKPTRDVFDLLGTNPIKHYKNFALLGQFVTETGRIKPASETGLRPVNQRRLAKAIRRAIGLGLMPSVYKHPEVLGSEVGLFRDVGRI